MKKRLICMLLSVLMIVSLFAGTSVSASAETVSYSTMTYRMASGDYVLRICQRLGLNYYVCKTAIMKLNNIQEGQWNKLPVGKLLTLPSTDADAVVITTGHGSTAKTTTTAATTTAATTIASTTPTNATVSASSSGDPIWFWIVPYELRTGETIADAMNVLGMDSNSFRDSIQKINKINEERPNIVDAMKNGEIQLVVNTPLGKRGQTDDSYIRKNAIRLRIPYMTTLAAAFAALKGIEAIRCGIDSICSLQEYHH